jgi:hypothetical protein
MRELYDAVPVCFADLAFMISLRLDLSLLLKAVDDVLVTPANLM